MVSFMYVLPQEKKKTGKNPEEKGYFQEKVKP